MSTFAVQAEQSLPQQITGLLKELHIIEHQTPSQSSAQNKKREERRQEIRRELVRIVDLLGWPQSYPLRLWMYGRCNGMQ